MFPAAEAKAAGYGGIAAVFRATGIAPSTIGRGLKELVCVSGAALDQVRLHELVKIRAMRTPPGPTRYGTSRALRECLLAILATPA